MSDIKNKQMQFEYQGQRSEYHSDYTDPNGNLWSIDVVGVAAPAKRFATQLPMSLEARPLTTEERAKLKRKPTGATEPRLSEEWPEEVTSKLPELEVTISLAQLVLEKRPHMVTYCIDPCTVGSPGKQQYKFRLKGSDTTANVRGKSNGGDIWLELFRYGAISARRESAEGTDVSVSYKGMPMRSCWSVVVHWDTGNPCYTLSGDITVN
jgi:hypothetical protein